MSYTFLFLVRFHTEYISLSPILILRLHKHSQDIYPGFPIIYINLDSVSKDFVSKTQLQDESRFSQSFVYDNVLA